MKGILFKPDMIEAIREGRKTVTRRLDHLKEINLAPDKWYLVAKFDDDTIFRFGSDILDRDITIKPRYQVGETVYIKEAYTYVTLAEKDPWKDKAIKDGSFRRKPDGSPVTVWYKLDGYEIGADWQTPLFMPAWAARDFIQILDVRPERLQEITEEDAKGEGVITCEHQAFTDYRHHFMVKWDSINPKYPFSSNPWDFRYEFKLKEK